MGAGILSGEVAAAEAPILNRVAGFLGLLASLNIALFVFNLIPLLPLDGGHIVVALWDGIKRLWAKLFHRPPPKPVDATKLVPVTFVVVIALIVMGAVLILADIAIRSRFSEADFVVRVDLGCPFAVGMKRSP